MISCREEKDMLEIKQIYKCEQSGAMVEVLHPGEDKLLCGDNPMTLLDENTTDAAKEKHVPVVEKAEGGVLVKVGSVAHPMEENHYIEWIEVHAGNKLYRQYLKPGDKPEAFFKLDEEVDYAREFCNLHGLWRTTK
jgi:superoxide reductase